MWPVMDQKLARFCELEAQMADPAVAVDHARFTAVAKELAGLSKLGEDLVDPPLQLIRGVPILGLVPMALIWFGVGEAPKIFLIALEASFPCTSTPSPTCPGRSRSHGARSFLSRLTILSLFVYQRSSCFLASSGLTSPALSWAFRFRGVIF